MAVSKRLRFEILRRDNFACRYCGMPAPVVPLTVDHVIPRVLGGTDDPANLVACCADCNTGKTSTLLDVIGDVTPDAAELVEAQRHHIKTRWTVDDIAKLYALYGGDHLACIHHGDRTCGDPLCVFLTAAMQVGAQAQRETTGGAI